MADEQLAKMKPQVYEDPRPLEYFAKYHRRTRTKQPNFAYEATRIVTSLYALIIFRARGIAAEKVPGEGGVIIAPNHFSFMDHFFTGLAIRRRVQFMAKSQLFKPPMNFLYTHGGVFPVARGKRDAEAFVTAHAVLSRGNAIVMYCEGGRSRTGKVSDVAKPGLGRLALESGVPVVPVAIHGSSKVRNWKRLQFPTVTVVYGDPIQFPHEPEPTRERQQAASDRVLAEIRTLYEELDAVGRKGVRARWREERRAAAS